MFRPVDPLRLPGTQESPDEVLARTLPLSGTQGEDYVKRRSIPLTIAEPPASATLKISPDGPR